MVSRHDFCVNLPVQFMAQASVTLQLLTGFSTHKIYRKFLIIKFVLWLACKRNLWLPWGKIAGIGFFLFFKSSPRFFPSTPSPMVHPHFLKVDVKSSLSSLANSGQTLSVCMPWDPLIYVAP